MDKRVQIHDLAFREIITPEDIHAKVQALGQQITEDYQGQKPHFVAVLNGAFIFAADLVRAVKLESSIGFVKLSSYDGLQSTGQIKTELNLPEENVKGQHIIIVEDIVDTGRTLSAFKRDLQKWNPASVKIASLLLKPEALQHDLSVDYLGFSIPPDFVIGYGLDYNEGGRQLAGIYQKI